MTCFQCSHPAAYNQDSLRWLISEKLICQEHKEEVEAILEKKNKPLAYKESEK